MFSFRFPLTGFQDTIMYSILLMLSFRLKLSRSGFHPVSHDSFQLVSCVGFFSNLLERVSIECRKTKTKKITVRPNKTGGDNPVNQSKLEVITRSRHKAREKVHAQATNGFGFTSDWLKK